MSLILKVDIYPLRFNIYQELVLAAVYKVYSFRLRPIFFYTYSVFFLQGVYMTSLYLLSWSLTGSWLTGVLTAGWVVANRYLVLGRTDILFCD